MDIPAVLAKLTGVVLLGVTGRSIYKHVRERMQAAREHAGDNQSRLESMLNSALLYAWLLFMLTFSTGMIVNN